MPALITEKQKEGYTGCRIKSGMTEQVYLVSIHKWSFCPISALCEKNNPRNIRHMPVVIFFACLDLEQKSLFMDGHETHFVTDPKAHEKRRLEIKGEYFHAFAQGWNPFCF